MDDSKTALSELGENEAAWHVVWTRSNCEHLVSDLLEAKGYEVFLPLIEEWRMPTKTNSGRPVGLASNPMFKGYLFVKHCIDREAFLDISNTRGVAHLLGSRWNALARVPEEEIQSIKCLMNSQLPLMPHPYLEKGDKVLITRGMLANTNGILTEKSNEKGIFVVSISLLKSSVAVSVDYNDLIPV
ncbi:transcription antitermination factor NusG [Litorivivens lipolytica]|uniref:Transcription antitermination factor NusG n=1 Tax=Litorivivens lipolytica TaxID=1524264 RepID=A0A7W4W6N1_9GAMM|nr:transcription termination/antitermination NusG family protein [Litorivivens lipolytica]MBB3047817.1 transcription antitermination factor NusG [Litorivivens lipolytica]